MGNQCLASTPIEHYEDYFKDVKVSEIKDLWTTVEVYKIKKLYDAIASKHPEFSKHTHLEFDNFMELFPELANFPEVTLFEIQRQKMRIFQVFNFDGHGFVDWNNFYSMISICYFASEEILAILMFLIFDESLSKQLNSKELELLCKCNENYILTDEQKGDQIPIHDAQEVYSQLMQGKSSLSIKCWIENCKKYFNLGKFRKIFNIFIEQKLEKELIKNFKQWNNLYVEDEDRYVSYLISYKWFETWKIYVKHEYSVCLNTNSKKPVTFKTKKMFKSNSKINTSKKIADALTLRELKMDENEKKQVELDYPEEIKNYDFIHSNIGDKPKEIYNKVLEGDYEQILKQDIIENRDYVLISEKVWKNLKRIYEGYPEFRRTGFDFIELYPKILRVLNYKNNNIEYQQENLKEVSGYYAAEDVLEAILPKDTDIKTKEFYYKAIGMSKWEKITDLTVALAEISNEVIIFILVMNKSECENFEKKFMKIPKDLSQINVGDEIRYVHPVKKSEQNMIFLGKNVEGKYILHMPGESYIYDICAMESDIIKRAKLITDGTNANQIQEIKTKKKEELGLVGIPNTKGLGYINSVFIHFYYNWNLKQQLSLFPQEQSSENEEKTIVKTLSKIFKQIVHKKKIDTKLIQDTIEDLLPDFTHFSVDMCYEFTQQISKIISGELNEMKLKDTLALNCFKSTKNITCLKCNSNTVEENTKYTLSLPILSNSEKYYEIIYVPYCQTLKSLEMKRYGFKLPQGALFKHYKQEFEKVAGLPLLTKYLLMEVYSNNIVKNYSTAKNDASLDQLVLRETDVIFAYELKTEFSDFINKHYEQNVDFENKEVKIDQFIDCKNSTRGWIFGKVCEKDFTPYGHRTIIRVIHKFSKGEQWEISYDVDEESVANFPTKSYLNGEQYHLRLQQRYFNEASNDMEICNIPLVVVLTNWMRLREFHYMIYLQVKRFIIDKQTEFDDEENEKNFIINSSKTLSAKSKKKTNKIRVNKLKEYLYGEQFPYKLNFVDYSGRCAVCFKFLKSLVLQGEQDTYCGGCELSTSEPISWQIKVADVMICVDWKKLDYFSKDIIKDHSSYANMMMDRKNDIETLTNCYEAIVKGYPQNIQQLCCNIETETVVKQQMKQFPQNLTIYLERVIEENGFIKILNKHIKFENHLTLQGNEYKLTGLTSIDGSNKSTKYRAFIALNEDEWLEYDGNVVKSVKKHYVEKLCVLNLYYKKMEK